MLGTVPFQERHLSTYAEGLEENAKRRYRDKIKLVGDFDPMLGPPKNATTVIPPVDASDLVSYLVLETSFVTAKQFKARKGLEAYNQFVSGWVKEVKSFRLVPDGQHISVGRVSQFAFLLWLLGILTAYVLEEDDAYSVLVANESKVNPSFIVVDGD